MAAGGNNENKNMTPRKKSLTALSHYPKNQFSPQNHGLTLSQHKKIDKRTGILRDNKLRPLNSDPYLPMLSKGAVNLSDLPTKGPAGAGADARRKSI